MFCEGIPAQWVLVCGVVAAKACHQCIAEFATLYGSVVVITEEEVSLLTNPLRKSKWISVSE
jgi:hypothetical protein